MKCLYVLVFVVLVGALALYSAYGALRAERDYPPLGRFIEIEGIRLHYVDAGRGRPIVLVHGASSTLREFTESLLPRLAEQHRVIAFDRPGFGYSDRPSGPWLDPAHQARLLRKALMQLNADHPILVGHSWAGSLVLAYLLEHPTDVAGGVLLAGASHPWEGGVHWVYDIAGIPFLGQLLAATLLYPAGQLLMGYVATDVFAPNPVASGHIERTGAVLALRRRTLLINAEDVRELSDYLRMQCQRYGEIERPLLLVTGDSDGVVPAWNHAKRLVKQAPRAEMRILENTGHGLHHTHPQRVSTLIQDFSRRAWAEMAGLALGEQ